MQYHVFEWRQPDDPERPGSTVWSLFKQDTTYFGPGDSAFMLNFRVDDLDAMIAKLEREGVEVGPDREADENGRFAWITDPEGHRIQLWEPAPGH